VNVLLYEIHIFEWKAWSPRRWCRMTWLRTYFEVGWKILAVREAVETWRVFGGVGVWIGFGFEDVH
jgi:hypothetical protein